MDQEREKAISKLKASKDIDVMYCLVDTIRIRRSERNLLLKQLEQDEDYLKVPMPLYFGSSYWMNLKNDSNKRVRAKAEREAER